MSGIVVADTGPLRYLILIGHADVLARLFGAVSVPVTVVDELHHPGSPDMVRAWAAGPAPWLVVHPDAPGSTLALRRPNPGERAAIALAHALGAGLLLIDDRAGVTTAREQGFRVTGAAIYALFRNERARLVISHPPRARVRTSMVPSSLPRC